MPLTAGPAAAGDLEGSGTHAGVDAWVRSLLTIVEFENVAAPGRRMMSGVSAVAGRRPTGGLVQ